MATREIIYRIDFTNGKQYIGELVSTDILLAHLNKWYPNTNSTQQQSSWEQYWKQDIAQNGFAHQTFVDQVQYWDLQTIRAKLRKSGLPDEIFNGLMELWNQDALHTAEAILIILSKNQQNNIGQVVNFLSRYDNAEDYFSVKAFENRKSAIFNTLINRLYLNFKNRKEPVIQEINDYLNGLLQQVTVQSGSRIGTVNLTKYKEVATAITLHITKHTINRLVEQMDDNIKNKPFLAPYIKELKEVLQNKAAKKKNGRNITYGELFTAIYDYIDANKQSWLDNEADKQSREAASDFLIKWMNRTSLSAVLGDDGQVQRPEDIQDQVKNLFIKFIREHVFTDTADADYQSWKQENLNQDPQWSLYYQPGLMFRNYMRDYNIESLTDKTTTTVNSLGINFLSQHWRHDIFPEQIALLLTQQGYNFPYRKLPKGNFIGIIDVNEIQWY